MDREPADRDVFVREACAGDEGLRREVESLFRYEGAADPWIERPAAAVAAPMLNTSASSAVLTGRQIGPYQIGALLGAGGMGEVYRARDTQLNREVALKVLPASVATDAERLARFQREAEVLAALNHPNIAAIYGLQDADGLKALVMELVAGDELAARITRGPIPVDEALPIARQICEALEAAHEQGIIHRDLKPANIKVRPDGTVKVLDFGLAKALDPASMGGADATAFPDITSPAMITGARVLLGTAAYMSPEQAKGRAADRRSDIWAFGSVLYEMLTGRRAFPGDDLSETVANVIKGEPDWGALPPTTPSVVTRVLEGCLQKDRRQRIRDIGDVSLALAGAFETKALPAEAGRVAPSLLRPALPVAASLMAGGLVAGLLAWSLWPVARPLPVTRFSDRLPPGQFFRNTGQGPIALSRDGRHVVYNTAAGLHFRSLGALEGRLIPGTEAAVNDPFFSPDGESVAYGDFNQLKRISITGGAPVVICPLTTRLLGASWNTDNTILFGQANGIMRVSANGGTPRLVIAAKEGEQVYGPQLLPDGDSVLFSVTSASGTANWDAAQIVVQSLSTDARKVLQGGRAARYVPTGHLVYAVGDSLFAVAFDARRLEVGGGPVFIADGMTVPSRNQTFNSGAASFAVSDTGTFVYLRGRFETAGPPIPLSTLVWVDRDGREEGLKAPPRRYVYPRIAPDGNRIALDIRDVGSPANIWIWDVPRQAMRQLTFESGMLPVWSPDGRRLVWMSGSGGGGPLNLYWQAADGTGKPERLTNSPHAQRPSAFTRDGLRLLVSEGTTTSSVQDLGMLSVDAERRVSWLVQTKSSALNGEISPDGRWLAYESDESGQFEIWVRPFPAVDQGRWRVSANGGREPLWAPRSGRELFYLAPDGALMGVRIDVTQDGASLIPAPPARLVGGGGYFIGVANQLGRTYDVSSDGARFLRIKISAGGSDEGGAPPDVVVVINWFEELKRLAPRN